MLSSASTNSIFVTVRKNAVLSLNIRPSLLLCGKKERRSVPKSENDTWWRLESYLYGKSPTSKSHSCCKWRGEGDGVGSDSRRIHQQKVVPLLFNDYWATVHLRSFRSEPPAVKNRPPLKKFSPRTFEFFNALIKEDNAFPFNCASALRIIQTGQMWRCHKWFLLILFLGICSIKNAPLPPYFNSKVFSDGSDVFIKREVLIQPSP